MSNLAPRLKAISRTGRLALEAIDSLETFVHAAPDEELYRVNPLVYGADRGLSEREAIDLFVHAAHAGIFDLSWNILCYGCGGYLQSGDSIGSLKAATHCPVCDIAIEATLDDAVEISFTVAPQVRDIRYHHPEALEPGPDLLRVAFSKNRLRSVEFEARREAGRRVLDFLPARATRTFTQDLAADTYRLVTATHHASATLHVEGEPTVEVQTLRAEIHALAVLLSTDTLRPGPVALEVVNASDRALSFTLMLAAATRVDESAVEGFRRFRPFLTGKRILTSPAFRDFYRHDAIAPGSCFALRSLTFLFTDLKDSTQLYDRIGDLNAYDLVQEHFKILGEVVAEHDGAIIKTIGDAIMATFPRPEGALRAAAQMHRRLHAWNQVQGKEPLVLKIGLHEGACIAVSSNDRIDYFGQTVNQAARIQALAGAGQIYLSEAVYRAAGEADVPGVSFLAPQAVRLKGISEPVTVYPVVPELADISNHGLPA